MMFFIYSVISLSVICKIGREDLHRKLESSSVEISIAIIQRRSYNDNVFLIFIILSLMGKKYNKTGYLIININGFYNK